MSCLPLVAYWPISSDGGGYLESEGGAASHTASRSAASLLVCNIDNIYKIISFHHLTFINSDYNMLSMI